MKTARTQTKIHSLTAFGISVTTDLTQQKSYAYNQGKLIYTKNLCGASDIGEAHLNNVLDFMAYAKTKDLRKPINF